MTDIVLFILLSITSGEQSIALSGTVQDADGRRVSNATVIIADGPPTFRFMQRSANSGPVAAPLVLGSGTTDGSGRFAVELPEEAPEFGWRRSRLTVWAYHPDGALVVRLIDRDWPRANLPLRLTLGRAESIHLTIAGPEGRVVAGAQVRPHRVAGHRVPFELAERLTASTNAEGAVTLSGVAARDLGAVLAQGETCGSQWAGLPPLAEHVTAIALAPVGQLAGRLTADDRRAVQHRKIRFATWLEPGDETEGGGLADVVTDNDGNFDVPQIAAGSVTFEIEKAAAPVYLTAQTTAGQVDPQTTTRCEIPLRRAVAVTQEVRDGDDGTPIGGVLVSLNWGIPGDNAVSDASGRLRTHVLPGRVTPMPIRFPRPYYNPQETYPGESIADDAETVSLKTMRLKRGVPVRGRVVDEEQRPIAGAEIVGFWPLPQMDIYPVHTWTNAQGEFAIEGVAPQTQVRLWARCGEAVTAEPVSIRPGGTPAILVLSGTASVSLETRVTDAAGAPVAGAAVRVWAEQRQDVGRVDELPLGSVVFDGTDSLRTDADGIFRTPRCLHPRASYSLEVKAAGTLPVETEAIEPDTWHTTRFADVVLQPVPQRRALEGRVADSEGHPVSGAAVWQSGDGPRRTETTTDEDGRFQLGGIYDGPAFVFARKEGFRLQGVRVAASAPRCEITLRRADQEAQVMTRLPPLVPLEERSALAMALVEPWLPMLRDQEFTAKHFQLLSIIEHADPAGALDIADTILTNPEIIEGVRQSAALALVETDLDEALSVVALLTEPRDRAQTCARAWDALGEPSQLDTETLLEEALVQARAESDTGWKVYVLGQIAERWLDLGQRERGTALLREGQALAEELPAPSETTQRENSVHMRGRLAGSLARIDGPSALRLIRPGGRP